MKEALCRLTVVSWVLLCFTCLESKNIVYIVVFSKWTSCNNLPQQENFLKVKKNIFFQTWNGYSLVIFLILSSGLVQTPTFSKQNKLRLEFHTRETPHILSWLGEQLRWRGRGDTARTLLKWVTIGVGIPQNIDFNCAVILIASWF